MATYAEPITERRAHSRQNDLVVPDHRALTAPIGRALFAAIFIAAGFGHFSTETIGLAGAQGIPFANILVPLSGILAIMGGVSILLGLHARLGAWLLVIFLLPVTFTMHAFWVITDPAARAMQQGMFMKNIAMLGGALLVAYFGAGPISLDARRHRTAR